MDDEDVRQWVDLLWKISDGICFLRDTSPAWPWGAGVEERKRTSVTTSPASTLRARSSSAAAFSALTRAWLSCLTTSTFDSRWAKSPAGFLILYLIETHQSDWSSRAQAISQDHSQSRDEGCGVLHQPLFDLCESSAPTHFVLPRLLPARSPPHPCFLLQDTATHLGFPVVLPPRRCGRCSLRACRVCRL
jgi:hypothetical protein